MIEAIVAAVGTRHGVFLRLCSIERLRLPGMRVFQWRRPPADFTRQDVARHALAVGAIDTGSDAIPAWAAVLGRPDRDGGGPAGPRPG
ncbi:hypothetical protein GCM10009850_111140 [Nonomuraea monospora]|uniref:Uncharacterized protein n=1 Tax=Nonomuraea monospora TaxID=568818 RepID=A0ABP5PZM3_9ACTN